MDVCGLVGLLGGRSGEIGVLAVLTRLDARVVRLGRRCVEESYEQFYIG